MPILTDHPVLTHPTWCEPRWCEIDHEPDGTYYVSHRAVLLGNGSWRCCVDVVQPVRLAADGTVVTAHPPRIQLCGIEDQRLTVDQAAGLAAGLARAAALVAAGGDR